MKQKELGVYIHIPFCRKKCYYCDFISYENKEQKIEKYIEQVLNQIEMYDFENCNITTIYIGGGTPSFIESKYIRKIIEKLREKINENFETNQTKFEDIEITIEVNPGTITEKKLQDYKNSGINRISMGLQSTNDNLLKQIGRIHNFNQFEEAYNMARKVGIDNCNIDLMIALPNQTIQDVKESLEKIIKLNPEHISVYSLILEENTKLYEMVEKEEIKLIDDELERQMYWYVKSTLELNDYNQYEISNFSKKGKESKHNINCWEQKEYIGIGTAAHSYINGIRFSNTNNLEILASENESGKINIKKINLEKLTYKDLERVKGKINIEEIQTQEEMKKEYMILGLRKVEGVSISKFKEKFIDNPIYLYRRELDKLVKENLIEITLDNIKLTNKGLDFANIVFEEFV